MRPRDTLLKEPFDHLYDLFLRFNRRLVFIMNALNVPLRTNESHLLGELLGQSKTVASELSGKLYLEKSTVSRLLANLEGRGIIVSRVSSTDGRLKRITLTDVGEKVLKADMKARNAEITACVDPLDTGERDLLLSLLTSIADAYEAPILATTPLDDPLLIQIRRLTRAMGFIGENILETGRPVEECQVLHMLLMEGGEMAFQDLSRFLPYELSDFSRLVSRLEKRKLLSKKAIPTDRRRYTVKLSTSGESTARKMMHAGGIRLKVGCKNLSRTRLGELIAVLERFVYAPIPSEYFSPSPSITCEEITDPSLLQIARAFTAEIVVREGLALHLPATLLHPSHRNFIVREDDNIRATLEIILTKRGDAKIQNLAAVSDSGGIRFAEVILRRALDLLHSTSRANVELPAFLFNRWLRSEAGAPLDIETLSLPLDEFMKLIAPVG